MSSCSRDCARARDSIKSTNLRNSSDAANRPAGSTPTQSSAGLPAPAPLATNPYAPPQHSYPPPQQYQAPPSYSYPQPSSSGNIDLSAIRPSNSGTVPLADAIAKAKAYATEKGITPYDRAPGGYPQQDSRQPDRQYQQRSRSKSPRGRDAFRGGDYNPYRDERRGEHGGQARDYGRERSFSPGRGRQGFSPHGASGGRDRSPLRKEDNSETIEIEASLVGLIIGRQGENLRRVETDSRCRVQFVPPAGQNDHMRLCKITGPRAQREEAKEMINRIIQESGMRSGDRGGRGGSDSGGYGGRESRPGPPPPMPVPKEGDDNLQIMVPDRTVGLIIGRGGETIRDLQERSGCHINIVGENKSINGLRPVNLIGPPAAARHAKELILEIVDSDSRNGNNPAAARSGGRGDNFGAPGAGGHDKINDSIFVPSDSVGMIIGKGGETIREMQTNSGCKINVNPSSGPNEVEREIGLVGTRDAIARAKQAIEAKVEAAVCFVHKFSGCVNGTLTSSKRQKGGGGGGGGGPRGRAHRDYDNPSYGQQQSNNTSSQHNNASSNQAAAAGQADQADPYAICKLKLMLYTVDEV